MVIVNLFEHFRKYKTEWVEDLPNHPNKNTIYIIGGYKYPFCAAITCPRRKCKKVIHLEISKQFRKRWEVKKHKNGSISLSPSVYVTDSSCKCHYWIKKGCVIWHSVPHLFIPKENKN